MKAPAKKTCVLMAIAVGLLVGVLSMWLIGGDESRKVDALMAHALCVLDLSEGTASTSATFTTARAVEAFQVGIQRKASGEALAISISGDHGLVASVSGVKAHSFGLGRNIQPGTYTVTLHQEMEGKGGRAIIAAEQPLYLTGWQIWSRTYVGLLALSGICAMPWRRGVNSRVRALSVTAFHSLLLGLVLILVYLLFHEGGHALAEITFGRFDLARSDFWGIRGHPHSGGTMGPQLKPWQQTVISCAGPMLPTLAGFGLFVLWGLPLGRKIRSLQPMVNLYFSATVAMLVFSEAICGPTYLLGFITAEGDLIGHVSEAGGPVWLVKTLLWGSFLICAVILWRIVPDLLKAWKTCFLETPGAALGMNRA